MPDEKEVTPVTRKLTGETAYGRRAEDKPIWARWEIYLSLVVFAIMSAQQYDLVPQQYDRLCMWFVGVLSQLGIVAGRPLVALGVGRRNGNGNGNGH